MTMAGLIRPGERREVALPNGMVLDIANADAVMWKIDEEAGTTLLMAVDEAGFRLYQQPAENASPFRGFTP